MSDSGEKTSPIKNNIHQILQEIHTAAVRSGRASKDITLIAVSKTKPAWMVTAAIESGIRAVGENYVQEAISKQKEVPGNVDWHFIGKLQRNKARLAVKHFAMIHSVDREPLAAALHKRAYEEGVEKVPILIEVDLANQETKGGIAPDELETLLIKLEPFDRLHVRGLMTMPPPSKNPEDSRPYFRQLREIRDTMNLQELSMGMSHDFVVAIEEGATFVRVGSAIFGARFP